MGLCFGIILELDNKKELAVKLALCLSKETSYFLKPLVSITCRPYVSRGNAVAAYSSAAPIGPRVGDLITRATGLGWLAHPARASIRRTRSVFILIRYPKTGSLSIGNIPQLKKEPHPLG